jgi:hypothetical protein
MASFPVRDVRPMYREAVVTGAAIFRSFTPFARQPTFDQHALKGRIQRSFLHLKDIGRGLLDKTGNLKAMQLAAAGESFEDQHIEGSGWNLVPVIGKCHDIDNLCDATFGLQVISFMRALMLPMARFLRCGI